MRKIFIVAIMALLVGCSVPGTYMSSGTVTRNSNVKGQLLNSAIIPIDNNLLNSPCYRDNFNTHYQYRVGNFDILSIVVWDHPELTLPTQAQAIAESSVALGLGTQPNSSITAANMNPQASGVPVNAQGEIVFPLIGKVKVTGYTVPQIQARLTTKLAEYIRNPKVSVQVAAYNSQRVNVIGEVVQPGVRPITDRPLTILDAISTSGGINPSTADAKNIFVIRNNNYQSITVYWLNAKTPQTLLLAENFRLANNDIVYVSPAGLSSWNRIVSQILPTVQTLWEMHALIRD